MNLRKLIIQFFRMRVICISEPPTHSNSFIVGHTYVASNTPHQLFGIFTYVSDILGNRYRVPSPYFRLIQ